MKDSSQRALLVIMKILVLIIIPTFGGFFFPLIYDAYDGYPDEFIAWWPLALVLIWAPIILVHAALYTAWDNIVRVTNRYTLIYHSLFSVVFAAYWLLSLYVEGGIDWQAVQEYRYFLSLGEQIITSDALLYFLPLCFLLGHIYTSAFLHIGTTGQLHSPTRGQSYRFLVVILAIGVAVVLTYVTLFS